MLNNMCINCKKLGNGCSGSQESVWTGCIYKERNDDPLCNVVSYIYDKTSDEMMQLAKAIKSGAKVLPIVKQAFEKVLDIRYTEDVNGNYEPSNCRWVDMKIQNNNKRNNKK